MERRQHPRVDVNFNAALMNEQILPIGCRVKNVSTGGMMLSHEVSEKITPIRDSDNFEIRFSLKQHNKRKVIQLPVSVARKSSDTIGARFARLQPGLIALVAPGQTAMRNPPPQLDLPLAVTTQSRPTNVQRSFAHLMHVAKDHRYASFGLISSVIAGSLLFATWKFEDLGERTNALESNVARLNNESLKIPLMDRLAIRQLDTINGQLESLNVQNDDIERRIGSLESANTVATEPFDSSEAQSSEPLTHASSEPWVINLLTLYNESAARDFTARANTLGIPAISTLETIDNNRVWRVQVSGFADRKAATDYSLDAQRKLGLESVWIFQNKG